MVILLIQKILSLFIVLLIGFVAVKTKIMKSEDSKYISILLVYMSSPCAILSAFQVDFTKDVQAGLLLALGAAILVHLLLLVIMLILNRVFRLNPIEKVSVMYSNCGNLIIPLVTSILGPEWVIYSSAFMAVQNFLLWSHCKNVISGETTVNMKKILKNINMIAILAGICCLLLGIRFTGPVETAVSDMGSMVGTLAMLVSGMLIAGIDLREMLSRPRIWLVTFLRLIAIPLLLLLPLKFLAASVAVPNAKSILLVTYLAAIAPSASTVVQQAQVYRNDSKYAGAINTLTTLGCILTMPLMVILYQIS